MIPADEPESSDVMTQGPCGDPFLFPVGDSSNTTPTQGYHSPAILAHTSGVLGDHPYPNRDSSVARRWWRVHRPSASGPHGERPQMTQQQPCGARQVSKQVCVPTFLFKRLVY